MNNYHTILVPILRCPALVLTNLFVLQFLQGLKCTVANRLDPKSSQMT